MINVEQYLKNFNKTNKNQSLDAMRYFMNEYNNFEKNMKFIHIAGTNGKGSCIEIISNILISQGYKVGKFLTPHLVRYNERITINRKEISNQEMAELIEELIPKIEKYNKESENKITFFELVTIIALIYFNRENVDFVVLETGLGGLNDCTNIITKPLVSIISSIGYDHTHVLGKTLKEITYQKAGIIKEKSNTVIFTQTPEINDIFINECNKKNNKLCIITQKDISNYRFDSNLQYFNYKDIDNLAINLKGKIQIQNASLCLEAVKILKEIGYPISTESIKKGLSTVIHRGRMEELNRKPLIIFDGAHNELAIQNLQNTINMYYSKFKRTYIISILKRKNYTKMLEILAKDKEATFVLTDGNNPDKYASSAVLYSNIIKYVESEKVFIKNIEEAIEEALNSGKDNVNFIIGSFYTYNTVREIIKMESI